MEKLKTLLIANRGEIAVRDPVHTTPTSLGSAYEHLPNENISSRSALPGQQKLSASVPYQSTRQQMQLVAM
jgi:hypothetical protein